MSPTPAIEYQLCPTVKDEELNSLFAASWPDHQAMGFAPVLRMSMAYVCAYRAGELVGYVNVAWDGRTHAFVLDTTVHPSCRRRGVGKQLVLLAIREAKRRGVTWVHVDFEPHLRPFYAQCGFRLSEAGVLDLAGQA